MANISKPQLKKCLHVVINTFLGLIVSFLLLVYVVLVIPLVLYRLFITKCVAPHFRPTIGKAVTVSGQFMAAEFIPENKSPSASNSEVVLPKPRCTIVSTLTFPGNISADKICNLVTQGLLNVKNGESELRYPELQQYMEKWMGFMFWKQDNSFSLENHVHVHRISDSDSREDSEKVLHALTEKLLNKRYVAKRSPWEIHLLQNYKNPNLLQMVDSVENQDENDDPEVMTVVIFRLHHAMVDGFSVMYAFLTGMLDMDISSLNYATPKSVDKNENHGRGYNVSAAMSLLKRWIYVSWRTLHDVGYIATLQWPFRGNTSTPWHAPDSKKKWNQLYARSKLIPIEKIKFIKNKFGVSFTGVLVSCLEAGVAKNVKGKHFDGARTMPIVSIVPLPNHPNKLRNHATAAALELNVSPSLKSVERLKETEKKFAEARYSQIPFVAVLLGALFSFQLAPVAKYLCENRVAPTGLTNFPGPGVPITLQGRQCLTMDFCVAGLVGLTGVVFSILSYQGSLRLSVTAENGVMERKELAELIDNIEKEIEVLYSCALNAANENRIFNMGKINKAFIADANV